MFSGTVQSWTEMDRVEGGSVRLMRNELLSLWARKNDSGVSQSRGEREERIVG